MTKSELAGAVLSRGATESKAQAEKVVDALLETITEALKAGDKIELREFGSFRVEERAARMGRNPRTNEPLNIPASKVVKFTPAASFKKAVAERK